MEMACRKLCVRYAEVHRVIQVRKSIVPIDKVAGDIAVAADSSQHVMWNDNVHIRMLRDCLVSCPNASRCLHLK